MDKTLSNLLSNRNFLIGLVIVVVVALFGWGYFSNNAEKKSEEESETKQEQTISTEDKKEEVKSKNIESVSPAENAEVALANAPKEIVLKAGKELAAGSEIKVASDKGLDVVTAGNKLTADLKTLSAPVTIEVAGTYTVSYHLNWKDGGQEDASYKFTVK